MHTLFCCSIVKLGAPAARIRIATDEAVSTPSNPFASTDLLQLDKDYCMNSGSVEKIAGRYHGRWIYHTPDPVTKVARKIRRCSLQLS